jgi:transcriptional regulator with XRE-family HTH domain
MPRALHSEPYKKFATLMREARKKAGLTQQMLGRRLSKPQSFIAKYESGERRLDVLEFLEVSAAIGCDPSGIIKKLLK